MAHINFEPVEVVVRRWPSESLTHKWNAKAPCTLSCRREAIQTVGHIWRFAELDPTQTWEEGQRRPWNASLKTLSWKIGESFVRRSRDEDATYGRFYRERKQLEIERN